MLNTIMLQAAQSGGYSGIIMIVAMVVIFYFFMIRPQSKKQKELKKAREALGKGSKVVTAGGIHGRVKEVKEAVMIIEIAPNVTIKVDKGSIYPAPDAPAAKTAEKNIKEEKEIKE